MAKIQKDSKSRVRDYLFVTLALTTIVLALCMLVPVWQALTAGLASLSIVIFLSFGLVLTVGMWYVHRRYRLLLGIALVVAFLAVTTPQLIYLHAAHRANTSLSFNTQQYLTFSGSTTLKPTTLMEYKQVGNTPLEIAFYESAQPGDRPLIIMLHGGGWRYGSHLETGEWPHILTGAGYHVASVEYRLSSDTYHPWQDAPADVHDAVTFLRTNHRPYRIDPDQLHLFGQSAGGHLALLEAYRSSPKPASVIALYAPVDVEFDYQTSRDKSAELDFFGGPPEQYPDRYRNTSPLTHVSHLSPRTLLIQGENDDLVDARNVPKLSTELSRHNVPHTTITLPLTGHSFENQHGGFATQITKESVLRFLSY